MTNRRENPNDVTCSKQHRHEPMMPSVLLAMVELQAWSLLSDHHTVSGFQAILTVYRRLRKQPERLGQVSQLTDLPTRLRRMAAKKSALSEWRETLLCAATEIERLLTVRPESDNFTVAA